MPLPNLHTLIHVYLSYVLSLTAPSVSISNQNRSHYGKRLPRSSDSNVSSLIPSSDTPLSSSLRFELDPESEFSFQEITHTVFYQESSDTTRLNSSESSSNTTGYSENGVDVTTQTDNSIVENRPTTASESQNGVGTTRNRSPQPDVDDTQTESLKPVSEGVGLDELDPGSPSAHPGTWSDVPIANNSSSVTAQNRIGNFT